VAKITVLSKEISELIAAGEVIDRPSSVVKELVENSIDSGANSVTVEIKNGGVTYIRITDNGCGISETDIATAFLRHATSKIYEKEDLNKILTLGFRGEALASIAAVSKVEVLTKQQSEQLGTHYVIEGSEEKLNEKAGCPDGTTIVIRDIFYNVPARLKFLKKDVTEGNSISAIVSKIALSHPEISIRFIRDNKQELYTPGDSDYFSDIYAVYGKSFAQTLIPVDFSNNGIEIKGYTVKPVYSRSNRSFQNFFINGRYIKSVTCTVSLEEAYKNSLMTGKFPACVLNIKIPPDIVDVNVHPAKIEVRFSDEKLIFDSVYFAAKNALMKEDKPKELYIPEEKKPTENPPKNDYKVTVIQPKEEYSSKQLSFSSEKIEYVSEKTDESITVKPAIDEEKPENFKYISNSSFVKKPVQDEEIHTAENKITESKKIRIIGEAFLNYIIAEVNDELLLIDKHAAHERIIFEKLKAREKSFDSQMLICPAEILLSPEEYSAVSENLQTLLFMGFSIKCKDKNIVWVEGVPSYLEGVPPEDIIPETAENLINCKNNPQPDAFDELFHSVACKSAIKANDKNDIRELTALAENVYNRGDIKYCPHGRPVMIKLTKKDIEKQFKRIL